jgi:hypothetical protein
VFVETNHPLKDQQYGNVSNRHDNILFQGIVEIRAVKDNFFTTRFVSVIWRICGFEAVDVRVL